MRLDYIENRLSRLWTEARRSKESPPFPSFDETDFHCLTVEAAIYLGHVELVRQLLADDDQSACVRRIHHESRRPELAEHPAQRRLELAAYVGSVEILELLLSADLGVLETELDSEGRMKGHRSAGLANIASKQGHRRFFNYILDISEPFPTLRRNRNIPRMVESDHYREAMRNTAFPEDLERMTAIFQRVLLDPGPPKNQCKPFFNNRWHQLAYSANFGRVDVVRYLLEEGVRIDAEAVASLRGVSNCRSPIICTITKSGSVDLLRLLLDHGADPNGSIPENAPLLAAIRWGTPAMVRVLLEYGADVNRTVPPAIIAALFMESEEIFHLLRGAGAVLDNSPQIGGRAMSLVRAHGLETMEALLINGGVNTSSILHYDPGKEDLLSGPKCFFRLKDFGLDEQAVYDARRAAFELTRAKRKRKRRR
jgi:ankyrin repeat protein